MSTHKSSGIVKKSKTNIVYQVYQLTAIAYAGYGIHAARIPNPNQTMKLEELCD